MIFYRTNPPIDMHYLTVLYLLKIIEDKVAIVNPPSAIIDFPEKILPHFFEFSPPTLITENLEEAAKFLTRYKQIVIKPLYSYGGDGVRKISSKTELTKLGKLKEKMVFQKYLPNISKGDKRILLLGGEVKAVIKRVPQKGSILANYHRGRDINPTILSTFDKRILKKVLPVLKENDVLFCGIDVIDNQVTEINITSPQLTGKL